MATTPVSVLDHEAFAAKHMPDLGYNTKEFTAFHWKLQGWRKLERKLTSPDFDCSGHKWRILLFPLGDSYTPPTDTVSLYLDNVNPNTRDGWHACAQFVVAISNPHDPTIYYTVSGAYHRFTAEERDWGFTRFSELQKLFQPQPGHDRPVIEGDSTVVSAYVRVLEDPTGALWHSFVNYNSKKETGYVGLKNLGATGYMNTVLQSLFCNNYLRKAVYRIPTEDKSPTESVSLALQRVFYLLQTSDRPVDTTELTKSFGWKPVDLLLSHDVQEFNTVLQHKLESEMKDTRAKDTISKLFIGRLKELVKCVNVDYESSRVEEFNNIQLKVKGMKTLHDSFQDYVAVKILNGEHGHQAGAFGLQDARAAVTFQSLPPVLHLQLKRYEYDVQRDAVVKIRDHLEFPLEIDLDEFLDETADRTEPCKYKLYGIFVHSGDTHGGHNFVLIKPDRHTWWLKFDDDRVTPMTDREVLDENYSGEPPNAAVPHAQRNQALVVEKSTNTNCLMYIRKTATDELMAPFTEEDTPLHLGQRLREERAQMEEKEKEREEPHLFLTAKVITDKTFSRHEGFDLAVFDKRNPSLSELPTFRVLKQMTYSAFKSRVAQRFCYPKSRIRLWILANRKNRTVRPDECISEKEPSPTVEEIREDMTKGQSDLRLYLDILPDPSERIKLGGAETAMIFLKHFDATTQSLFGIGKVDMSRASKVNDLTPVINERMKWASRTPLKVYEEIKPGMIELMKPNYTLTQSEIRDGDIICFQAEISHREIHDLKSQGLCSDAKEFYNFLQHRVVGPNEREEAPVTRGIPEEDQNATPAA